MSKLQESCLLWNHENKNKNQNSFNIQILKATFSIKRLYENELSVHTKGH